MYEDAVACPTTNLNNQWLCYFPWLLTNQLTCGARCALFGMSRRRAALNDKVSKIHIICIHNRLHLLVAAQPRFCYLNTLLSSR